jgi:hypothetical protein
MAKSLRFACLALQRQARINGTLVAEAEMSAAFVE